MKLSARLHRNLLVLPLLALASPGLAQDAPLGCFVRDYSDEHLKKNPEQVVDRISILFSPFDDNVSADVKVLLADQGHAGRDGYGGQRAFEIAGNYYKPLRFSVDCDGGSFDVVKQDAAGITIETSGFRLAVDGCIDEGISTTLAEEGSTSTRYRLNRAETKACDW